MASLKSHPILVVEAPSWAQHSLHQPTETTASELMGRNNSQKTSNSVLKTLDIQSGQILTVPGTKCPKLINRLIGTGHVKGSQKSLCYTFKDCINGDRRHTVTTGSTDGTSTETSSPSASSVLSSSSYTSCISRPDRVFMAQLNDNVGHRPSYSQYISNLQQAQRTGSSSSASSALWNLHAGSPKTHSGPTPFPAHIHTKNPEFSRVEPSPLLLFYYDETAPNDTLLVNDIRDVHLFRDSKKKLKKFLTCQGSPDEEYSVYADEYSLVFPSSKFLSHGVPILDQISTSEGSVKSSSSSCRAKLSTSSSQIPITCGSHQQPTRPRCCGAIRHQSVPSKSSETCTSPTGKLVEFQDAAGSIASLHASLKAAEDRKDDTIGCQERKPSMETQNDAEVIDGVNEFHNPYMLDDHDCKSQQSNRSILVPGRDLVLSTSSIHLVEQPLMSELYNPPEPDSQTLAVADLKTSDSLLAPLSIGKGIPTVTHLKSKEPVIRATSPESAASLPSGYQAAVCGNGAWKSSSPVKFHGMEKVRIGNSAVQKKADIAEEIQAFHKPVCYSPVKTLRVPDNIMLGSQMLEYNGGTRNICADPVNRNNDGGTMQQPTRGLSLCPVTSSTSVRSLSVTHIDSVIPHPSAKTAFPRHAVSLPDKNSHYRLVNSLSSTRTNEHPSDQRIGFFVTSPLDQNKRMGENLLRTVTVNNNSIPARQSGRSTSSKRSYQRTSAWCCGRMDDSNFTSDANSLCSAEIRNDSSSSSSATSLSMRTSSSARRTLPLTTELRRTAHGGEQQSALSNEESRTSSGSVSSSSSTYHGERVEKLDTQQDYEYTVRKLFFDVKESSQVADFCTNPMKTANLELLPTYSVSYQYYPSVCYEAVVPTNYSEFFRTRIAPIRL